MLYPPRLGSFSLLRSLSLLRCRFLETTEAPIECEKTVVVLEDILGILIAAKTFLGLRLLESMTLAEVLAHCVEQV